MTRSQVEQAQVERAQVEDVVQDLMKVVSAGDKANSGRLRSVKTLPRMKFVQLLIGDDHGKDAVALAITTVVQDAIAQIRSREDRAGMTKQDVRQSEALERLFGYSPRTRGMPSSARKEACWDYYFQDPKNPDNDFHSRSKSNFFRRDMRELLLSDVAREIIRKDRDLQFELEGFRSLPDAGKAGGVWLQGCWNDCYFWLLGVSHELGSIAKCVGLLDKFKPSFSEDERLRISLLGQLAFHIGAAWRILAALDEKELEDGRSSPIDLAGGTAYSYYTVRIRHGHFAKYFSLGPAEVDRLEMAFAAGMPSMSLGQHLMRDPDGLLVIAKMTAITSTCGCQSHEDWTQCHVHAIFEHSKRFDEMLREDWWALGHAARIGGYEIGMITLDDVGQSPGKKG